MLLLTWKFAFSIKPYSSCNSRIYLSLCYKGFWGYIQKKKKREEKVRRERERKGQVSY
jgi:hypothetical protein